MQLLVFLMATGRKKPRDGAEIRNIVIGTIFSRDTKYSDGAIINAIMIELCTKMSCDPLSRAFTDIGLVQIWNRAEKSKIPNTEEY